MDDRDIIELYWNRSEDAIAETQKKYGAYCLAVAKRILTDEQDAWECVNDTYLGAWNSIPPQRPNALRYFLAAITRNLAMNRLDYKMAQKRSGESALVLDELAECVSDADEPVADEVVLKETVNRFLASLDRKARIVFLRRYWYLCSVSEIASGMQMSENAVKVSLHRTRNRLKAYLEKEGISL